MTLTDSKIEIDINGTVKAFDILKAMSVIEDLANRLNKAEGEIKRLQGNKSTFFRPTVQIITTKRTA